MVSYSIGTSLVTIIAIIIAAFFLRQIVIPACIYIIEYVRNGQTAAEDKALDAMGENKMSYAMKDSMQRNRLVDDPRVNKLQDQTAETVGSVFGKNGALGSAGQAVSSIDSTTQDESGKIQ